jgi:hypothetical protein
MSTTASYVDMAKYLETLIRNNAINLGIADVYYGDQNQIPRTPSVAIEPGGKIRELNGAPRRTRVTLTNYVIVYHNPMKPMAVIRQEDDERAEAIEALIHANAQLSGLVIDSMVTSIESGYLMRERTMFRSSRLTVEAHSQEMLPYSA